MLLQTFKGFSVLYSLMIVFDFGISAAVARLAAMFADYDNFQSNIVSLLRTGELLLLILFTGIKFAFSLLFCRNFLND